MENNNKNLMSHYITNDKKKESFAIKKVEQKK